LKKSYLVSQSISPGCNGVLYFVSLTSKRYNGKQEELKTDSKRHGYEIRRFDNDEDKIIQDRLKQKTWNEIRTNDSWAILKLWLNL
jgi:hypothetical protein